jgi:hypothetical protein
VTVAIGPLSRLQAVEVDENGFSPNSYRNQKPRRLGVRGFGFHRAFSASSVVRDFHSAIPMQNKTPAFTGAVADISGR